MGMLFVDLLATLVKSWAVSICVMYMLCQIFGFNFDIVPANLIWMGLMIIELYHTVEIEEVEE